MAKRVLVLDDDAGFRRELERVLQRLGHETASFAHWSDALDHIEQAPALDSVVTELHLADGPNGVSFAQMARHRRPGVRLAFMTADRDLASRVDPGLGPVYLKAAGPERIGEALSGGL